MIGFRTFVLINSGKEVKELTDEELAYWENEYEEAIRYDRQEQKGKDKAKGIYD